MSLDHWRTVQRLAHVHEPVPQSLEASLAVLDRVIPACTALTGYAFDDMTRDDAWRFLVIGRHLERMAFLSSAAMQALGLPDEDCDAVLGALLEIGNVSMTYRARYQRHPELMPVLDLLVLDESNPHSVCFQSGGALQPSETSLGTAGIPAGQRSGLAAAGAERIRSRRIGRSAHAPRTNLSPRCWRLANAASTDFPMSSPNAFSFTPANARRRAWRHESKRRATL